jgi:hypothetical protein
VQRIPVGGPWERKVRGHDLWGLDPATERRTTDPAHDLPLVELLECLHGTGAGVYPPARDPLQRDPRTHFEPAGEPFGFVQAIGYPLAIDAERGMLLTGRPEGAPRSVPCAELVRAWFALPLEREGERDAVLRFCGAYGLPFVPFEALSVVAGSDVESNPLLRLSGLAREHALLPLYSTRFEGRWFGFCGTFRLWWLATAELATRATHGVLGAEDVYEPGRADGEAALLRVLQAATYRVGAAVTPDRRRATATVRTRRVPLFPVAAVLSHLLAMQEDRARKATGTLPCNDCGKRVSRDAKALLLAAGLGEPQDPLAFCRTHRSRRKKPLRAMCERHPEDAEAAAVLAELRTGDTGREARHRASAKG